MSICPIRDIVPYLDASDHNDQLFFVDVSHKGTVRVHGSDYGC